MTRKYRKAFLFLMTAMRQYVGRAVRLKKRDYERPENS
mgnify:CR=1 FL=1